MANCGCCTMMFTTVLAVLLVLLECLPGSAKGSAGSSGIGFAPPQLTAARAATESKGGMMHILSQCSRFRSIRDSNDGTASQTRPSCRNRVVIYAFNNNNNNKKKKDLQVGTSSSSSSPKYKPADDGRSVGFVLLGMSLLISAWLFTIPPSFRRAYLCPSDYFTSSNTVGMAQQQQEQVECVPLGVWWSDVVAYYQNGGGIQWDFSIDPQTVRDNQDFLDAVITSYSGRGAKSN